ncbi:ribonuclease G [Algiphilus sp.]|uniref:ribonuclease G n=2 Tax=Algiphilus sp. TaxID=1872431 RepID=UPI001CA776BC|nr:ribonuclease G [Algiphilus acroporae]MCI5062506.1 ribonuclease G [Algiphilus sp.]
MSTEILVNIAPQETRVALVESGVVQEAYVQRALRHGLVGNLYVGQVQRVLPGMQAAFVDIGLERTGFLHASDMVRLNEAADGALPLISSLLHEGQRVLVQVLKDPLGSKGARLTTLPSIPSRYLVLLPYDQHVGVSARIEDDTERERLRTVVTALVAEMTPELGVIVRTAGEGATEEALRNDLRFLQRLWSSIQAASNEAPPRSLVHGDLPLSMRILRDLLGVDVDRVRVDNAEEWGRLRTFARTFIPDAVDIIEHYDGAAPIFDLFGVEDDLNRALDRRVPLKSGGHLVIDQTEAMTTVDVNTGAYTGHRNLEETALKTNLEAAQAIARQLRLRNLGGIIIIDFIDMHDPQHREQITRLLERCLARDPARSVVCPLSPLGLVEMTRKRTRESLGHILCEPCPACEGRGYLKTVETVCYEIFREVQRSARQFEAQAFLVLAAVPVIERLRDDLSVGLAELEEQLSRPVRLQPEPQYLQESFDVVPI